MAIDVLHAGWTAPAIAHASWGWLRRALSGDAPAAELDAARSVAAYALRLGRDAPNEPMIVVVGLVQISAVLEFDMSAARQARR